MSHRIQENQFIHTFGVRSVCNDNLVDNEGVQLVLPFYAHYLTLIFGSSEWESVQRHFRSEHCRRCHIFPKLRPEAMHIILSRDPITKLPL